MTTNDAERALVSVPRALIEAAKAQRVALDHLATCGAGGALAALRLLDALLAAPAPAAASLDFFSQAVGATIRSCRHCGTPNHGGPTACVSCANGQAATAAERMEAFLRDVCESVAPGRPLTCDERAAPAEADEAIVDALCAAAYTGGGDEESAVLLRRLAELRDDVASARRALTARDDLVRALELQRDEARAETDAWHRQAGALVQQILAARAVLAMCETRTFDAPEDEEVAALGERIGFGALMSAASKGWARWLACNKVPLGSQFTCGPCESTVWKLLADIDRTLRETSHSPRAAGPRVGAPAPAQAIGRVHEWLRGPPDLSRHARNDTELVDAFSEAEMDYRRTLNDSRTTQGDLQRDADRVRVARTALLSTLATLRSERDAARERAERVERVLEATTQDAEDDVRRIAAERDAARSALAEMTEARAAMCRDRDRLLDERDRDRTALAECQRERSDTFDKWHTKARVYGAIAARYQQALAQIDHPEARAAEAWRHSERGGVPRAALDEMQALLDAKSALTRATERGDAMRESASALVDAWLAAEKERRRVEAIEAEAAGALSEDVRGWDARDAAGGEDGR